MDVDLDLAAAGYLRAPDGRVRWVEGLDRIAQDTVAAGVRVVWGWPPGGELGVAYWRVSRMVVLAVAVWDLDPGVIREVWTHEVGHCQVGGDHTLATAWQMEEYGDLLLSDVPA